MRSREREGQIHRAEVDEEGGREIQGAREVERGNGETTMRG